MKSLVFGLVLLTAIPSFASKLESSLAQAYGITLGEPISGELKANVIKALKEEITRGAFDCAWNVKNGPSNTDIKSQLKTILDDQPTIITIDEVQNQPIISAINPQSESLEVTIDFTTSSDLKKIIRVDARKESIEKKEVNVGTLIKPVFQVQEVRTATLKGNCAVQ